MYTMSEEEFEEAVRDGIDAIPDDFLKALDNVAIVVDDEPTHEQFRSAKGPQIVEGPNEREELLGLYEGIPLTKRGEWYDEVAPDVIHIFKGPHERCFQSREQIVAQIPKTVIHEIGHYFGMSDEQLHEMGY